jgi:hypothetical protein
MLKKDEDVEMMEINGEARLLDDPYDKVEILMEEEWVVAVVMMIMIMEEEEEEKKQKKKQKKKCLHSTVSGIAYWVSRFQRVPKIAIQLQTI